jgi:hypothetical protein
VSYRFTPSDGKLYTSPGALVGLQRNQAFSYAALLKRRATSVWHSILNIENGAAGNFMFPMEFNPGNNLAGDFTTANPFQSAATFADTVNWMIVGLTWDGSTTANKVVWRWKIGSAPWSSELETSPGANASAIGSGYHMIIGVEAGSGDDADFDMVCIGAIRSELSQAQFESLTMTDFLSWRNVFAGSGAWLLGFQAIDTIIDMTGNGGNETSRTTPTLQPDPPGWEWAPHYDFSLFPKPKLRLVT